MNELDLSSIYASYERSDGRGLAAYHPTLMARLLLYGYCTGITSSRKIEQATYDNVAFRYLSADQGAEADEQAWYRAIYLSKVGNAIYVLHCFEKESRKTDRRDIEAPNGVRFESLWRVPGPISLSLMLGLSPDLIPSAESLAR
jgi:hypothetical protein